MVMLDQPAEQFGDQAEVLGDRALSVYTTANVAQLHGQLNELLQARALANQSTQQAFALAPFSCSRSTAQGTAAARIAACWLA